MSPSNRVRAVVMAAGQGTRMKSPLPKVLHEVQGKPMVERIVRVAREAGADGAVIVVGYGRERVEGHMESALGGDPHFGLDFALQPVQNGTADAVRCALPVLERFDGWLLILNGDVPNVSADTLRELIELGQAHPEGMALVTTCIDDASGYGRIVRREDGRVARIVEDKDCDDEQRRINEINAGMYMVPADFVREHLAEISTNNAQRELYLTDLIELAGQHGEGAYALLVQDPREVAGVNDRDQLAEAELYAAERA